MSARERETYEATAKRQGDGEDDAVDRMAAVVSQVLAAFRGAIRANPNVTSMGADGTLPDFCILPAATIGRNTLIGLNPVSEGMTDPRKEEQREAERFLRDLRTMGSQAFGDDPPVTSATTPASYGGAALLDF